MRGNLQVWWHQILTEYSRRKFTYHKDILYALSGIAERMYMFIEAPYLAGFWADRFLETLCWRPSISFDNLKVPPLPEKDPIPGMPSWSCLSICHPIGFAVMDHPGVFDWKCSFLHCDFAPVHNLTGKDFSALRGRKVVLEGLVMEMELVYPKLWKAASAISGSLKSIAGHHARLITDAPLLEDTTVNAAGEQIGTVRRVRHGDKPESSSGYHKVLALYIGRWKPSRSSVAMEGVDHCFVLVLAPSTRVPGAYERLGMTDSSLFHGPDFFNGATVQRIETV
jgi:hypothetical protein